MKTAEFVTSRKMGVDKTAKDSSERPIWFTINPRNITNATLNPMENKNLSTESRPCIPNILRRTIPGTRVK